MRWGPGASPGASRFTSLQNEAVPENIRRRRPFGARRAAGGVTLVFAWAEATATKPGRPAGPAPWSGPELGLCWRISDTPDQRPGWPAETKGLVVVVPAMLDLPANLA